MACALLRVLVADALAARGAVHHAPLSSAEQPDPAPDAAKGTPPGAQVCRAAAGEAFAYRSSRSACGRTRPLAMRACAPAMRPGRCDVLTAAEFRARDAAARRSETAV